MQENIDQWTFVLAAYAIGIGAILTLSGWSWTTMRAAERRRDKARERGRAG